MFSYRSLLKEALNTAWKHKYLWFFGLFASLTAAGGSWEYQFLSRNLNGNLINTSYLRLVDVLTISEFIKSLGQGIANLFRYDFWTALNGISVILVTLALVFFIIWLAITSQASLVDSAKKLMNSRKKPLSLSVRDGLTIGHRHFWPVLCLNILIKVVVAAILFLISLPLLFMIIKSGPFLAIIYIILFVIFIPIVVGLSLMIKYAIAYRVLDNHSVVVALEKGFKLFQKNWLVSLEMALLLFFINLLAGLALLFTLGIFIFPLLLLGIMFQLGGLILLTMFLAIVLIILLGAFLTTFQISAWTDLFLQLRESKILAKLERIFSYQR